MCCVAARHSAQTALHSLGAAAKQIRTRVLNHQNLTVTRCMQTGMLAPSSQQGHNSQLRHGEGLRPKVMLGTPYMFTCHQTNTHDPNQCVDKDRVQASQAAAIAAAAEAGRNALVGMHPLLACVGDMPPVVTARGAACRRMQVTCVQAGVCGWNWVGPQWALLDAAAHRAVACPEGLFQGHEVQALPRHDVCKQHTGTQGGRARKVAGLVRQSCL